MAALAAISLTLGDGHRAAHANIPIPTISLNPQTDTNIVGDDHTVTATVDAGGDPVEGAPVTFEVIDGPNTGDNGIQVTDANGQASFTYTGDGGAGTDMVSACVLGPPPWPACDVATKDWVEPAPAATPTPTPPPGPPAVGGIVELVTDPVAPPAESKPLGASIIPIAAFVALGLLVMGAGGIYVVKLRRG